MLTISRQGAVLDQCLSSCLFLRQQHCYSSLDNLHLIPTRPTTFSSHTSCHSQTRETINLHTFYSNGFQCSCHIAPRSYLWNGIDAFRCGKSSSNQRPIQARRLSHARHILDRICLECCHIRSIQPLKINTETHSLQIQQQLRLVWEL